MAKCLSAAFPGLPFYPWKGISNRCSCVKRPVAQSRKEQYMHRIPISLRSGIALAALASAFCFSGRQAVAANNFYQVPIAYTWDHMSYDDNPGDWNIAIGDSGFDAGEIPGNKGTSTNGPAVTVLNNDPVHGYTGIPLLIGPTTDGANNVQVQNGQTIPVVPGKYKALYVNYSGVNGPHNKPIILDYTDGQGVITEKWADWCSANQAPPDFFTWAAKHRNNGTGQDNNSCSLITKYIPVNPNRTLVGITMGLDEVADALGPDGTTVVHHGGGEEVPGDTITSGNGRTVLGSVTLVSDDASLGGYGVVTGKVLNADGTTFVPDAHEHVAGIGAAVAVIKPYLGNYSAGANLDGTYTIGLPPGTYTLSAAVRKGADDATSSGLQATPITVTVEAGKTVTQDIKLLADANPNLWGSITGKVNDASGAAAVGQFIAISDSADGPFRAYELAGQGLTAADGTYTINGIAAGDWYVKAGSNSSVSDAVKVTVTGGGSTTVPDLSVKPLPIGSVTGTIKSPSGSFGGLGQTVKLVSKADPTASYTTTSLADPPLNGNATIPETGVTSIFNFDAVPAGAYTLTLVAGASQGQDASQDITVTQGQATNVDLTSALPAYIEGTANANVSDPLTGPLNAKWTVADVWDKADTTRDPGTVGAVTADGNISTAGGSIDKQRVSDQFTFFYQTVPIGNDFAASLDVLKVPSQITLDGAINVAAPDAGGRTGLMIREDNDSPLAANAFLSVSGGHGIQLQGREATNLSTFPFYEAAALTDPNSDPAGTSPSLPVSIKLRKVGPAIAAYYSTDKGATEKYVGSFLPEFAGSNLRVGIATTSGEDTTSDVAQVGNFSLSSLGGTVTPPVTLGDLNGDGKVNVQDATTSLRIAVGSITPTDAQKAAGDVNHDGKWNVQDTTLILRFAVGANTTFP
jgi:hypothetical protein